jgi:hypothetical protein
MCSITSCSVTARRRALERIEVHAHEIDRSDAVLRERGAVPLAGADRQQARVDAGVKCLDPTVEDLGKAGVGLDRRGFDAGLADLLGGAAGGDDLHPELAQRPREVDHAPLVEDGHERSLDLELALVARQLQRG